MTFGITAWSAYIPRPRLERSAIASAHQWVAPSLKGLAKGRRAYCSWDEDIVTMAVEAARNCLRKSSTNLGNDLSDLGGNWPGLSGTQYPL